MQREELVTLTYYILANFLCIAEHFKHSSFPCHLTKESVRCVHFMLFVMRCAFVHLSILNICAFCALQYWWLSSKFTTLAPDELPNTFENTSSSTKSSIGHSLSLTLSTLSWGSLLPLRRKTDQDSTTTASGLNQDDQDHIHHWHPRSHILIEYN